MAKSARMPNFAGKDEHRVVFRPRGGLVVSTTAMTALRGAILAAANITYQEAEEDSIALNAAQNIIVLSTPSEKRSFQYGSIRRLTIGECSYETFAYKATPDNTSRGVISGVEHDETDEEITKCIVNKYNPTAMAAHRLGNSTSVVILFEGQKVPHYVKYGGFIAKCTLYCQHREVCKICGQVGHRKDVCPTPNVKVCFACGRRNPGEDHAEYCKPKCRLCGGSHVTGAGSCKNKFKTPIQIKKRQWAKQNAEAPAKMAPAPLQPAMKARLSRRDEFSELEAGRKGSNVVNRDWRRMTSDGPTWADITTGESKTTRPQRSVSQKRERERSQNKIDVTQEGKKETQRRRSVSRGTKTTPDNADATPGRDKESGRMPSNGCEEQYKRWAS